MKYRDGLWEAKSVEPSFFRATSALPISVLSNDSLDVARVAKAKARAAGRRFKAGCPVQTDAANTAGSSLPEGLVNC